jgi:hypothetical protein
MLHRNINYGRSGYDDAGPRYSDPQICARTLDQTFATAIGGEDVRDVTGARHDNARYRARGDCTGRRR